MLRISGGQCRGGEPNTNRIRAIVEFVPFLHMAARATGAHQIQMSEHKPEQEESEQKRAEPWQN